jgi:hypothetical protein
MLLFTVINWYTLSHSIKRDWGEVWMVSAAFKSSSTPRSIYLILQITSLWNKTYAYENAGFILDFRLSHMEDYEGM